MAAPAKRKTAPRKPAKRTAPAKANGQTNGHAVAKLAPPEQFVPREQEEVSDAPSAPEVAAVPAHPFGDRRVQVFTPTIGEQQPFAVPHISTVEVTEEFLWNNHRQNLDMMHQSWAWMDLAGIPDDIQRQVVRLDLVDKRRFWQEWFQGYSPPIASEPPGES